MSKEELIEHLNKRMDGYTSFYEHPQNKKEHTPLENAYNEGVRRGLAIAIVNIRENLNQNKKKITKEEASRKIVEYFNQHQMVGGKWDSIMYTQKKFVMELLNQQLEVETQDKVREAAERLVDVYEWDDWNDDIIILISPIVDLKNVLQNVNTYGARTT